ncbi:MAG: molybdopterin-dependent oxidoreductase, partial [Chloroflexi bacterium]|nr:molybdopterin-dependent oxidoreductase [Chloroflexota bacterium]
RLAHVVLPAATWVEREATHTWIDRRVQKVNKVVNAPGEAKPDWWIICQLAEKMGYGDKFKFTSSAEIFDEIRNCVPQYKGITYERLEKTIGGIHWPCPSEEHPGTPTMFLQKFNTTDGLGHFQAIEYKPPAEVPDDQYPYVLTTGRSIFHYHTGSMTRRTPKLLDEVPRGFVEVNPDDASRAGVKSKDVVTLETRRGSIEAEVKVTDEVQPGLLFVPFHFPDSCANVLTISALDPSAKCAETKVCAVKMKVKR